MSHYYAEGYVVSQEQGEATPERIRNYDWMSAFAYAPYDIRPWDVAEVVAAVDGENDGDNWVGLFRLHDGRYLYLSAGCDYTGWDCRAGGAGLVASSLDKAKLMVPPDEATRLWS